MVCNKPTDILVNVTNHFAHTRCNTLQCCLSCICNACSSGSKCNGRSNVLDKAMATVPWLTNKVRVHVSLDCTADLLHEALSSILQIQLLDKTASQQCCDAANQILTTSWRLQQASMSVAQLVVSNAFHMNCYKLVSPCPISALSTELSIIKGSSSQVCIALSMMTYLLTLHPWPT